MAQIGKTFRIFVSSTFSDLKEERNALQRDVFPKLRELCMQHGCRFQAIDLRWGVREEAALDQQTMKICLTEIERCQRVTPRPNFIVLLGDRYGWCPVPFEIPAAEFNEIKKRISDSDKELLTKWYERDNNAVPPVYCLQPRTGEFTDSAKWKPVEREMRSILLEATAEMELKATDRIKYTASATEQEIVRGLDIPDAEDHVFCFFRKIEGIPHDQSAEHFIDLDEEENLDTKAQDQIDALKEKLNKKLPGNIFEYEAVWQGNVRLFAWEDIPGKDGTRLLEFLQNRLRVEWARKAKIKKSEDGKTITVTSGKNSLELKLSDKRDIARFELGRGEIYQYPIQKEEHKLNIYDHPITTDHLNKLCKDVYDSLASIINKEIAKFEEVDPRDKEIADHESFGKERVKFFVGRTEMLQTITKYVKGKNPHPLGIYGESGSGKSVLIAKAVEQAQEEHPNAEIIFRFIGATPDSSDGRALLESLCRQISRRYTAEESTIPTDYRDLVQEFPKRLAFATKQRPLILFLDALDQLSETDYAHHLYWLPVNLPENVRIIISTLPGECLSILEKRLQSSNLVELNPMPADEGEEVLDLWLKDAGRALQPDQQNEVLTKFRECGLPLYLKLTFEEARRWKSYDPAIQLSSDIPGMIKDLFERLSLDSNHGRVVVSHSLGYLAAARHGLTEDELLDVLSEDADVLRDFKSRAKHELPKDKLGRQRIPVIVWSRLYFDLEPYITENSADGSCLMGFYHPQLAEAVAGEFLSGEARRKRHQGLAQYFGLQPLWIEKKEEKTVNVRKVSELPRQQTYAELWAELETTLTDLQFIEAKCKAGSTYELITDYELALNKLPEGKDQRPEETRSVENLQEFVRQTIEYANAWSDAREGLSRRLEKDALTEAESIALPDIISSVEPWSDRKIEEDHKISDHPTRFTRIEAFSKFLNSESHILARLASHPGFCVQHAYNSGSCGPVVAAAESLLKNETSNLVILQTQLGRREYAPHPALLRTIEGHMGPVSCAWVAPDAKGAVSGGWDETIRVWDLQTGECLRTLRGHTLYVSSLSVTPDKRIAASGSADKTIRVWDLQTGDSLAMLEGHSGSVEDVALTPDGRMAVSGSSDNTLKVWDLWSGECLRSLVGHTGPVVAVAVTPNGRMAISGSSDNTLKVWDLWSGECLRSLVGHAGSVEAVDVTQDGRVAMSGSSDGTLKVWDIQNGENLRTLRGHKGSVVGLALTPDGRVAISGGLDRTLRIWNLRAAQCVRTLKGHTGAVYCVSATPVGERVVSGSSDRTLRLWDTERGESLVDVAAHTAPVRTVSITRDATIAVSGSSDTTLRVWRIADLECLRILEGHTGSIHASAITPDGEMVVSGGRDSDVRVWNLKTGRLLFLLKGHTDIVSSLAIAPGAGGGTAVSAGADGRVLLWDLGTRRCLQHIMLQPEWVSSASITPDGRIVVSGGWDKTLRVWDFRTFTCLRTLKGHTSGIVDVCITQDGRMAISGGWDGSLRVWDLRKGRCTRTIEGHRDCVTTIKATPDGKTLISLSADRTARVWDIETGICIGVCRPEGRAASISNVSAYGTFVIGTYMSEVIPMALRNFHMRRPVATAVRHYWLEVSRGQVLWGQKLLSTCQWCGLNFPPQESVLDVIRAIARNAGVSPDHSPCLELQDEAWEEPGLLSECPLCHKPLKFNPFIVDNRDRY